MTLFHWLTCKPRTMLLALGSAILAGSVLTGCAGLTGNDPSLMTRDMYDIKNKLDKSVDDQNSSFRKLDYSVGTLDKNQQERNEAVQNRLNDLDTRLRELMDEMQKLRNSVDTLSYRSEAGAGGATPSGLATPPAGEAATQTPATGTTPSLGSAVDQAMQQAMMQLNTGQYAQAREGFMQALGMNPTVDRQMQIYYNLANACLKLNDLPSAYDNFYNVIKAKKDNNDPLAWASVEQMANIKISQGDNAYAATLLQKIIDANDKWFATTGKVLYPNIDRVRATMQRIQPAGATATPAPATSATPAAPPAANP